VAGKRSAHAADRVADLQGTLGDHQDAVVARAWLHDAARDSGDPETAFVAGRLAGAFDEDRARLRARWRADWKRARRLLD
jgi:CHAD domain-containing protein